MTLSMPPPRTECADSKQYEQEILYCQFRISNFSTDGHERFRWNRFDLSVAEVAIGSSRTVLQLCKVLQLQHFLRSFEVPTESSPLESKFAAQDGGGRNRFPVPCRF